MTPSQRPRVPLQGLVPEQLVAAIPGVLLGDARRVIAQVHRDEDIATPSSTIRRSAREAVVAAGSVPGTAPRSGPAPANTPLSQ